MKKIETTTEAPATNLTPETSAPSAAHSATPTFGPTPTPPHSPTPDLLQSLVTTLQTYVVLPPHAAEALALWTLHTYAFQLRDITTYLGIESPEKRCGKTTLLTVLSELCNRAIVASNISSPAFFRVIEETKPTLLIDEADTFLQTNEELRGILNSGYTKKSAHVIRVVNQPSNPQSSPQIVNRTSSIVHPTPTPPHTPTPTAFLPSTFDPRLSTNSTLGSFSTWCPKAIAAIGHLPDTLADRCIVVRMQRKTHREQTQRLRNLDTTELREKCAAFVARHADAIAKAQPQIPEDLNDRAADIWEPLLVLADIAGGDWPQKARRAAVALSASSQETNPIGALLMDLLLCFGENQTKRLHTHTIVEHLQYRTGIRPWNENLKKPITDLWLAQQLRPYGICSKTIRIDGTQAKGYIQDDHMTDAFRRYIPKTEIDRIHEEFTVAEENSRSENSQPHEMAIKETAA